MTTVLPLLALLSSLSAPSVSAQTEDRGQTAGRSLRRSPGDLHARDHFPYNKASQVACHNCYEPASPFARFAQALDVTHAVEVDIQPAKARGRWVVTHKEEPSNHNNCDSTNEAEADFAVCLAVVRDRLAADSTFEVVTVFVDIKGLKEGRWRTGFEPSVLDSAARSVLDTAWIFTPSDLRGWQQRSATRGSGAVWPTLGELHRRVILVLTGEERDLAPYRSARDSLALFFTARKAKTPEHVDEGLASGEIFFNIPLPLKVQFDRGSARNTVTAVAAAQGASRMWALGYGIVIPKTYADKELRRFVACYMSTQRLTFMAMYRNFNEVGGEECKDPRGKPE